MSWSISAIGKPAAVAAKIKADLSAYECSEPEETIRQTIGNAIAQALEAMPASSAVKVTASGSQSPSTEPGKFTNSFKAEVENLYGFVE